MAYIPRIIFTLAREKHTSHFLCYKKSCAGERRHEHPEHPCLVRHAGNSEPLKAHKALWHKFAFSSKSTSQSKTLGNLLDSTLPSQWEDSRLRWAATNYENVSKVRKNASSFKRLEKKTTLWTFKTTTYFFKRFKSLRKNTILWTVKATTYFLKKKRSNARSL